jgi:ATP-binding cassette subfamily F protein 3
MEKKDKLSTIQNLEFTIDSVPFKGRHVFTADKIAFGYHTDRKLFADFSMSVNAGDRIGIIGKNGRGKTTLLKVLAGVLAPLSGKILFNPNIETGYFEQSNAARLVDTRTVEEEILLAQGGTNRQAARNVCGAMLFSGDNALKKIGVLSGGEKSRVLLGKILIKPVNLLLLDEPTNHLDMDACDALLAALDHFDGTVIVVTHNEMFLHALAQRLVVFQNGRADVFEGTYPDFLDRVGWNDEASQPKDRIPANSDLVPKGKLTKKKMRQKRSEIMARRTAVLKPIALEMSAVEKEIDDLEKEMARYNQEMINASTAKNGKKIASLSREIHHLQGEIDRLFDTLEDLTVTHENREAKFEAELSRLTK